MALSGRLGRQRPRRSSVPAGSAAPRSPSSEHHDEVHQLQPTSYPVVTRLTAFRPKRKSPATQRVTGDHFMSERATGLEPATSSLGSWHSTN